MDTLLIQLTHQKAASLIRDLEEMHIIKVLKNNAPQEKLSDRFEGKLKLSDEQYKKFDQYLTDSRNEWDRNI
jgi:hypothetical protein